MDLPIEPSDLDRLTPQDKVELRQFINNEQQRSRVQARMSYIHFHLTALLPPPSSYLSNFLCIHSSSTYNNNQTPAPC